MAEEHAADEATPVTAPIGPRDRQRAARARLRDSLIAGVLEPANVLGAMLLLAFVLRAAWIDQPPGALVFDETYYVNAARVIVGVPVPPDAPYADAPTGLDPNEEHPPLGKLLIAGSMRVFGDTALGWRLPSVVAGMVALLAFFALLRTLGAGMWFALLALGLFAFDNLEIVHGRIGTLDVLVLAPVLVAALAAARGRWLVAGVLLGLAALVKLTALYALLALLVLAAVGGLEAWRMLHRVPRRDAGRIASMLAAFGIVWLGGLWALDLGVTRFTDPVAHVRHMVSFGADLSAPSRSTTSCGGSSTPWQWPFNDCPISYLQVSVGGDEAGQGSTTTVAFWGALNPVLASAIPLAGLYAVWLATRTRDPVIRWAVIWGAANWLPLVVLALTTHRIMYLYYAVPILPAVAIAVAALLTRGTIPRPVAAAYLVAFGAAVVANYPFRTIP